jgi:hypothetical protein
MKTKSLNTIAKVLTLVLFATFYSGAAFGQFIDTDTISQDPVVEERKGNTSTYTVAGPATDEYSWQVYGGEIVVPAAGVTGLGTEADPYVVPFTVGLQEIQVEWPADDNTITSVTGNVSTQRRVPHSTVKCPSSIQSLDVILWSNPTATILDADYEICSGDATSGDITVEFTGAPEFTVKYTITDLDGTLQSEQTISAVNGSTTTIPIPANLLNTSSTDDQTYVVTLTEMNDDFQGPGSIIDGSFTLTVHPTVETGPISSDNALTRN